jgi:tetratricopeptide (TPR) repeat protein/predicted Ser/Thr protein kinase
MPVGLQGTLLAGRYRVLRHLGSGGMASVLLCTDERLGRRVAVKRLHSDQAREVERRFAREAKLGASLNHPSLVAVYDTATDDEGVLIVMEYVEGEPLSRVLRHGPLEPERFGRMAVELGDALDHAHAQGVVHRDVKPANVLLRTDGMTKLVDLGIATAADHTRITRSGVVLGTASYMAPEQLDGRPAESPADIYAYSCVCFEALSGRRARTGRTAMEIAHRIATEPPPDLREALPGAPPRAAALLAAGMARDPQQRPASAGELGRGLRRELEAKPAAGVLPPAGDRAAGRRRPGLVGVLLALATLALAAAVVAGVVTGGDDDQRPRAQSAQPDRSEERKERKARRQERAEAQETQPAPAPEPTPTQPAEPETQEPEEPAAEAPAEEPSAPADDAPAPAQADGASLNDQGFALMNQGRYDEAIPLLERAVASYPPGSSDLGYAYALFNLGRSLRLAGRAAEAVPILERRLQIPNQTGTVKRELALARRAAG